MGIDSMLLQGALRRGIEQLRALDSAGKGSGRKK